MMDHPTDLDLAEFVDRQLPAVEAEAIQGHLEGCARCRALVAEIGPANWTARAPALVVPPAPQELVAGFNRPPAEPRVGELWRLEWEHDAALALVLEVAGRQIRVVPTLAEPIPVGASLVQIATKDSPLQVALAAWAGLVTWLPEGVFHVSFGQVSCDVTARVHRAVAMKRPLLSPNDAAISR